MYVAADEVLLSENYSSLDEDGTVENTTTETPNSTQGTSPLATDTASVGPSTAVSQPVPSPYAAVNVANLAYSGPSAYSIPVIYAPSSGAYNMALNTQQVCIM